MSYYNSHGILKVSVVCISSKKFQNKILVSDQDSGLTGCFPKIQKSAVEKHSFFVFNDYILCMECNCGKLQHNIE